MRTARYAVRAAFCGLLLLSLGACDFRAPKHVVERDTKGEADRGEQLLFAFGCVACHEIPGMASYPGHIGPPLRDWNKRAFIAGKLPNDPESLVRWIVNPQDVEPGTAMPDLGVTEAEARDMAAYLYAH